MLNSNSNNKELCSSLFDQNKYTTKSAFNKKTLHWKIKPSYYRQLNNYPNLSILLISINWPIINFMKRIKGFSVLCEPGFNYDLSCCNQREVWILYSSFKEFAFVKQLGLEAQTAGAIKVLLIRTDSALLESREAHH